MKKTVRMIILSLILIMVLPMFGGCGEGRRKAEKHCNDYLAAIPVEFEGYKILQWVDWENGDSYFDIPREGEKYTINEKEIIVEYDGIFKIIYDEKETVIDKEFMANNSEAYNKINNVWKGYDKENPEGWDIQNEVESVFVFDDNLFIITFCDDRSLIYKPERIIPKCLYRYDLETKTVQFCDFIKLEGNQGGSIIIFKNNI